MARKKKHKHHEEEAGEAWLLPYSDLMTLLLAVFIVLFAVSKIDQTKAEEMSEAFKGMMSQEQSVIPYDGDSIIKPIVNPDGTSQGGDSGQENTGVPREELEQYLGEEELVNMEELKDNLDHDFEEAEMEDAISTNIDQRGLVITLNNAILFDSGSAEIKPQYQESLAKIGNLINKVDNHIRVEGHTDNRPIVTSVYPSNWELSAARATRVVRLFISECDISPAKVVAVGYGEYKPIADNDTEEGRKKNRRIDIIILGERYNQLEEQYPVGNINN
jgi:chemotaxis protein MotB